MIVNNFFWFFFDFEHPLNPMEGRCGPGCDPKCYSRPSNIWNLPEVRFIRSTCPSVAMATQAFMSARWIGASWRISNHNTSRWLLALKGISYNNITKVQKSRKDDNEFALRRQTTPTHITCSRKTQGKVCTTTVSPPTGKHNDWDCGASSLRAGSTIYSVMKYDILYCRC